MLKLLYLFSLVFFLIGSKEIPTKLFEVSHISGGDMMILSLLFCASCIFFTLTHVFPYASKHYFFWPLFFSLSLFFSFFFHMRLLGFEQAPLPSFFVCHKASFMTSYICLFFCSCILFGEEACEAPWADELEFMHQEDTRDLYKAKVARSFYALNLNPLFVSGGYHLSTFNLNIHTCLILYDIKLLKLSLKDLNSYLNVEDDLNIYWRKRPIMIPGGTKRFIWLNPPYSTLKLTLADIQEVLNILSEDQKINFKATSVFIDSIEFIEITVV